MKNYIEIKNATNQLNFANLTNFKFCKFNKSVKKQIRHSKEETKRAAQAVRGRKDKRLAGRKKRGH